MCSSFEGCNLEDVTSPNPGKLVSEKFSKLRLVMNHEARTMLQASHEMPLDFEDTA